MSKVLTVGTFDMYHSGHVNLFRRCRKLSGQDGLVTVGVNSDTFVKKYKGSSPIQHIGERMSLVRSCKFVDHAYDHHGEMRQDILVYKPDFLVVGSDWASKDYYAQIKISQQELDKMGVSLIFVPYTQGISTTELKKRILES